MEWLGLGKFTRCLTFFIQFVLQKSRSNAVVEHLSEDYMNTPGKTLLIWRWWSPLLKNKMLSKIKNTHVFWFVNEFPHDTSVSVLFGDSMYNSNYKSQKARDEMNAICYVVVLTIRSNSESHVETTVKLEVSFMFIYFIWFRLLVCLLVCLCDKSFKIVFHLVCCFEDRFFMLLFECLISSHCALVCSIPWGTHNSLSNCKYIYFICHSVKILFETSEFKFFFGKKYGMVKNNRVGLGSILDLHFLFYLIFFL